MKAREAVETWVKQQTVGIEFNIIEFKTQSGSLNIKGYAIRSYDAKIAEAGQHRIFTTNIKYSRTTSKYVSYIERALRKEGWEVVEESESDLVKTWRQA